MTPDEIAALLREAGYREDDPRLTEGLKKLLLTFYGRGYDAGVRKGARLTANAIIQRTNAIGGPQTATPRGVS